MDCKKCGNTGKIGKDTYCGCVHGEVQNRMDRGKRKAERQKEKEDREREAARKRQSEKQLELLDDPKEDVDTISIFKMFDWVRVEATSSRKTFDGVIIEILPRAKKVIVEAKRFPDGSQAMGQATCSWDDVTLLPIDVRKNDLQAIIDFAIDTNDHEWLKELSERIAAC